MLSEFYPKRRVLHCLNFAASLLIRQLRHVRVRTAFLRSILHFLMLMKEMLFKYSRLYFESESMTHFVFEFRITSLTKSFAKLKGQNSSLLCCIGPGLFVVSFGVEVEFLMKHLLPWIGLKNGPLWSLLSSWAFYQPAQVNLRRQTTGLHTLRHSSFE